MKIKEIKKFKRNKWSLKEMISLKEIKEVLMMLKRNKTCSKEINEAYKK